MRLKLVIEEMLKDIDMSGEEWNDMPNPQPDLNNAGYGYDELKDFDDGYKGSRKSRITPFMGPSR
jgi:hypothetical protein